MLEFTYAEKNLSTQKNKKNQKTRVYVENEKQSGEGCFKTEKTDGSEEINYRLKC